MSAMSDPWVLPQASPAGGTGTQAGPAPDPDSPPGEEASERFPIGSDAGWRPDPNMAGLLRLWDGRHWTEHTRPFDPGVQTAASVPEIRTNNAVRAWALMSQLLLSLWITVSCVAMLWQIATLNTLSIWQLQPGDGHDTEARRILQTMLLIYLAQGIVWLISIIFFFVWMGVARHDRYMNPRLMRGSMPGTVIGWWIPFLRIRVTWRALTDVLQASDPARAGDGPMTRSRAAPPLVLAYVLLRFLPAWIGLLLITRTREALGTVDQLRDAILAGIVGTVVLVATNIILIIIITRVTDNLRGRAPAPGSGTAPAVGAAFTRS